MKKVSGKFLALEIGIVLLLGFGLATSLLFVNSNGATVFYFLVAALVFCAFIGLFWALLSRFILEGVAKKTMAKADAQGIRNDGTFTTSNAILRIDIQGGRIVYVAYQNPFELQVVSAAEITDIQTWWNKAPMNATSYVAFQFNCRGKRVRIPTFTSSRTTYLMSSSQVQTGISKADTYCGLLAQARQSALSGGMR